MNVGSDHARWLRCWQRVVGTSALISFVAVVASLVHLLGWAFDRLGPLPMVVVVGAVGFLAAHGAGPPPRPRVPFPLA